jgi:hypothetical protein
VTPYAAGCAYCGADLDPRRWDTGPSATKRAGAWWSSLGMGPQRRLPWATVLLIWVFGGAALSAMAALLLH